MHWVALGDRYDSSMAVRGKKDRRCIANVSATGNRTRGRDVARCSVDADIEAR